MSPASWVLHEPDPGSVEALKSSLSCPRSIAAILATRQITPGTAPAFLAPGLADLHDPLLLMGMSRAVERIQQAVASGEKILIYGDYDVDGTTATVLLKTAIERTASPDNPALVSYHVPHRLREGYGIQNVRLAEAAADNIRLVISVDTGIRAFAAADEAKALGLDLIVTDHHLPDGVAGNPEALAVINPAQPGCQYPNKQLCGAGVAFKLAHALLAAQASSEPARQRLERVLIPSFLKLVAIATIADSVPLTGENRAIVWLGLRELARPVQPGLRALMRVAKLSLDAPPSASQVGFRLAPRINAAGRMDIASDVVELFLTRDEQRATELAHKLDALNQDRRASEASALAAIELKLLALRDDNYLYPAECIILDHPDWHRGVLGILASRIVERTGRPALVLASGEHESHGSGRSIPGFHLLDALSAVQTFEPIFTRFGGHTHAVGFSLLTAKLDTLRAGLQMHAAEHLTPQLLQTKLLIDAEVELSELTPDLAAWLDRLAPFGQDNKEPVFVVRRLVLSAPPRMIKEIHICLPLANGLSVMGWSRSGHVTWSDRIASLNLRAGSEIACVFHLRRNVHPQFGSLELEMIELAAS